MVVSRLPEASNLPSGLIARDQMTSVWPVSLRSGGSGWPGAQAARSHNRTVLSTPAEASILPSGLTATLHTAPVCPWRSNSSLPVAAS
jgi:hypothetical protein